MQLSVLVQCYTMLHTCRSGQTAADAVQLEQFILAKLVYNDLRVMRQ